MSHLTWVRLQQLKEQHYSFLPLCAVFSCVWHFQCAARELFPRVCFHCAQGLCEHHKTVCNGSWLWEKNLLLHRELKLCQCCAWIFHPMLCQLSYSAPDLFFTILFFIGLPLSLNMRQWHPLKTSHPKVKLCSKTNQKTELFSVRAAHSSHVMISFETNFCFDVIAALPPGKSFFSVCFLLWKQSSVQESVFMSQYLFASWARLHWLVFFISAKVFGCLKEVLIGSLHFCQGISVSPKSTMCWLVFWIFAKVFWFPEEVPCFDLFYICAKVICCPKEESCVDLSLHFCQGILVSYLKKHHVLICSLHFCLGILVSQIDRRNKT